MQEHIHLHHLGGGLHDGIDLQLGTELVGHSAEQGIVTDLHELEGVLQSGEHQPVLVDADGVLAVLLHQLAGPHITGGLVKLLHQGSVLGQVIKGGNDLINGATGVSGFIVISIIIAVIYVFDKYILKDNIFTKTIEEVLEDVEG